MTLHPSVTDFETEEIMLIFVPRPTVERCASGMILRNHDFMIMTHACQLALEDTHEN